MTSEGAKLLRKMHTFKGCARLKIVKTCTTLQSGAAHFINSLLLCQIIYHLLIQGIVSVGGFYFV